MLPTQNVECIKPEVKQTKNRVVIKEVFVPKSSESGDALHQVLMAQRFAVLATQQGDQPYINLIAFAISNDHSSIIFATSRNTQKYRNIQANNKVAILIDSRRNELSDFSGALAITALGLAHEVAKDRKDILVNNYINRHPTLEEFLLKPETAAISIKIMDYILARFDRVERIRMRSRS
jgi:nitroimidazol reductase NimA-like FMN-containing flavoprotein (pyridoxamine 5'-phosphate oxidase superfamily)